LGLLSGTAFAVFYATLGVPIAIWADRGDRRLIISISGVLWSIMTAACGAAQNFTQLALARIGVGVGEAGGSPPSHSIISDMFSPKTRTTALAIYTMGIPFGIVLAIYGGAQIAEEYGWRMAFYALGIPGVVLALLVLLTIAEPQRGMSEGHAPVANAPPFWSVVKFMLTNATILNVTAGATLTTIVGYAGVQWWPTFLIRSHGLTLVDLSLFLALIFGLATGIGTLASGWLADRLSKKDPRWMPRIVSVAILIALPFAAATYLVQDSAIVYALIGIPAFAGAFYLPPTFAMTQGLVTVRMRTVASALLLFIVNLVGMGIGPALAGYLSDLWTPAYGKDALAYALLAILAFNAWAALHYWLAGITYERDFKKAQALNAQAGEQGLTPVSFGPQKITP
jgi:MFS family permease